MRLLVPSVNDLKERAKEKTTNYAQPIEIGHFSINHEREIRLDKSQLKKYIPCSDFFRFSDVSRGFKDWKRKPDDLNEGLRAILMVANDKDIDLSSFDLITWRGVITRIISSPWSKDAWRLAGKVEKRRQEEGKITIYLSERKIPKIYTPKEEQFMFSGHKFETLMMSSDFPMSERQSIPVDSAEFGIVCKTHLGENRILMGAEVDGIDSKDGAFIELKTCSQMNDPVKRLKWFLQSWLVGITRIIVGFRDRTMRIRQIESIKVSSLIKGREEDYKCALSFGELFLAWLRMALVAEGFEEGEFCIEFSPVDRQITLSKIKK